MQSINMILFLVLAISLAMVTGNNAVVVETKQEGSGPAVTRESKYVSHVTLYIEKDDGSRTPSGWSTRQSEGATVDQPFKFQPGVGLIQGWTEGVLKMKEGERAELHVPAELGYGGSPMGSPGGAFYIPANSNLLFDIEILGKAGGEKEL
eukprot:CAMPEP_0194027822 /NCGR_PEP_ID=MMETSP0009_2-20130614/1873_1 /TAXON_ID=210454 /ORGANISM="Grammatophora oceanica, Strain CCMP 410" /LENGTH=149 /DNA_ID=CAMNT_0038666995 /DNA_START=75 /DNA_END=524 /DNA_ORIENTATION=-